MLDSFLNIKTNQEPLECFPEEINEKFFTVSEISRGNQIFSGTQVL